MASLITQSTAAAQAPLQTDLLRNSIHRQSGADRIITGAAIGGSAAAGDCAVDLYVSDINIATLYNFSTLPSFYQMYPADAYVPAGSEIRAVVIDAPQTNPLLLVIQIDDVPAGSEYSELGATIMSAMG